MCDQRTDALFYCFFFNDTATTEIYTLSLHDALPISNNVANYPADSPEKMAQEAKSAGYLFHYLYDESQKVAKAYRAACTPDIFLFDADQRLVYRGQFDDSRPSNGIPVTGKDLRAAMDAVLEGKPVTANQKPSIGCNIKW